MLRNNMCCPKFDFPVNESCYTFSETKTTSDFTCILCMYQHTQIHIFDEGTFSSTSDKLPVCMSIVLKNKNYVPCKHRISLPA
jgi:hypothetical protein